MSQGTPNKPVNDEPRKAQSFGSFVVLVQFLKKWLYLERGKHDHSLDEINVRRVFDITTDDPKRPPKKKLWKRIFLFSVDETSTFFYYWSLLVFVGTIYNLITIVVYVFEDIQKIIHMQWIMGNIFFDCAFLIDLFILTRQEYIDRGVRFTAVWAMLLHRIKKKEFAMDVLALVPFDILLLHRKDLSVSRLNRLLKLYRVGEFYGLTEIRTSFPTAFRLFKLIFLCFIIFHWNGCLYYFISISHGYANSSHEDWVFTYDKISDPIFVQCDIFRSEDCRPDTLEPLRIYEEYDNLTLEVQFAMNYWRNKSEVVKFSNFTKQYGLSFYWSALTLVTLGEQPSPNTTFQNAFEIVVTLLGLVIFAVIVGDVGNMVHTMNLQKAEFEEVLDGTKGYMIRQNVNSALQKKTIRYFGFVGNAGKIGVGEEEICQFLPVRLYGQMAVHIHMETLRRVKLFEECEPALLYELILKLEPQVYSPMDYICRKGEVGKEMYVVKHGFVEVVNDDGSKVFVRLGEGTVFGELSILNIPGNKNGNRRTANVRSAGYTDLYTLKKEDLWEILRDYPDAKVSLLSKGHEILVRDNLYDETAFHEDDWDPDSPIEDKLLSIKHNADKVLEQLIDMERTIRRRNDLKKQKVTQLEKELMELLKKQ